MEQKNKTFEDAYAQYAGKLLSYAESRVEAGAEDLVHDAFIEVMGLPDLPEGDIEGLLMQRLKWRISDALRASAEVLECELGSIEEDGAERPMDLSDLEEAQAHHGSIPPWPGAIDYDTPEQIVTAAQMRDKIRQYAVEYCGQRAYAVFCAYAIDDVPQAQIAKVFHMDQATVSRTVNMVRETVLEHLAMDGYAM